MTEHTLEAPVDTPSNNVVTALLRHFTDNPNRLALYVPVMDRNLTIGEESATFAELAQRVAAYQAGWRHCQLQPGDRVVLFFRPCIDFYAMTISLMASGMVPVFLDTGLNRRKLVAALVDSKAKAIVSVRRFLRFFWVMPALWRMKRFSVDGISMGVQDAEALAPRAGTQQIPVVAQVAPDHAGLISFTSGSSGKPKGVERTHASLRAQHQIMQDFLRDDAGDMDMTCFPVWVLHNLCCGKSTIIPKVDLARPSQFNANAVHEQILRYNIERISGAPAFLHALAQGLQRKAQTLDRVRSIIAGRAEVFDNTLVLIRDVFPNARVEVLYGTAEAEPISSIEAAELLADGKGGAGYLVGYPAKGVEIIIARLPEGIAAEADLDAGRCAATETGEVLISGAHVVKAYINDDEANQHVKIPRANGMVWHRTGDAGYVDEQGRLWLTGQLSDVIARGQHWLQPLPMEKRLEAIPGVTRAALLQTEDDRVVLVLQINRAWEDVSVPVEHEFAQFPIAPIEYALIERMAVDDKYNSKIDRPLLREMIAKGELAIAGEI